MGQGYIEQLPQSVQDMLKMLGGKMDDPKTQKLMENAQQLADPLGRHLRTQFEEFSSDPLKYYGSSIAQGIRESFPDPMGMLKSVVAPKEFPLTDEQLRQGINIGFFGLGPVGKPTPGAPLSSELGQFPTTTVGRIRNKTIKDTGYSVNLPTGEIPTSGLMMGKYANTDPRNTITDKLTNDYIRIHQEKNAKAFANLENYYGTYHDPNDLKYYLDVSKRFEPEEIRAATKFGEATAQNSGYNVGTKQPFPVYNSPKWLGSPEFQQRLDEMHAVGEKHMGGIKWWDLHGGPLQEIWAANEKDPELALKKIAGFIASTSPKNAPEVNLRLASEYIRRMKKGEPLIQPDFRIPETAQFFTPGVKLGMESSRVDNILKAGQGNLAELRMDKVNDMAHALMGDTNVGVFDRRFAKLGDNPAKGVFMEIKPNTLAGAMDGTPENYAHMDNAVRTAAARAGKTLSDYSSEVWEGIGQTIKKTGQLFGVQHGAQHIPESSQGFNVLMGKVVKSKADFLGIPLEVFKRRLAAGDAELLTAVISTPVGMALYDQYQRQLGGQVD